MLDVTDCVVACHGVGMASRKSRNQEQTFTIDSGTASIQCASEDSAARTLFVNGVPSSSFYAHDPVRLDFEYLAAMHRVVQAFFVDPQRRLFGVHIGGAACALPRALAHSFPQSRHVVAEVDESLIALVREQFELPRAPVLKIRPVDGAELLVGRRAGSATVLVRDAFAGDTTPEHLADEAFYAQTRRVLADDGLYVGNIAVRQPLTQFKAELALLGRHYPQVGVLAESGILRGKRGGNVVVFGSAVPMPVRELQRIAAQAKVPSTFWSPNTKPPK